MSHSFRTHMIFSKIKWRKKRCVETEGWGLPGRENTFLHSCGMCINLRYLCFFLQLFPLEVTTVNRSPGLPLSSPPFSSPTTMPTYLVWGHFLGLQEFHPERPLTNMFTLSSLDMFKPCPSLSYPPNHLTCAVSLVYSFLFRSILITPKEHLNIFISWAPGISDKRGNLPDSRVLL